MQFNTVDDILDFAIKNEEEAAAFYTGLAQKMDQPVMAKLFEDFAKEEKGHKAKLEGIKKGKTLEPSKDKILDLKLADYLVEEEPKADMDYQTALILAMKKEKSAFRLYNDLATQTDDDNAKNAFLALAQEEAKHKLRFELEYDNQVYKEN